MNNGNQEPTLNMLMGEMNPLQKVVAARNGYGQNSIMGAEEADTTRAERIQEGAEKVADVSGAVGKSIQDIFNSVLGVKTAIEGAPKAVVPVATGTGAGALSKFDPNTLIIPGVTILGLILIMGLKRKARR